MEETQLPNDLDSLEMHMLVNNKTTGFNYRMRREEHWRQNYELYRDEVEINRFTQRQSVNLPLMKTTLRTLMKDIDDMPVVEFENLDNDKEAEVFQNEYWKVTLKDNVANIQDVVDKKQDFFYGRTFDSWQIVDGKIVFDIEDPEDMLVDRFMNPYNLNSSEFLIHTHIFVPLSTLKEDSDLDQEKVKELEEYFKTQQGIIKAKDNENSLQLKNQKMADLGVTDIDAPVTGETYVELTYHFVFRSELDGKPIDRQIVVYCEAEERNILMRKLQEEIIGVTSDHWWRNHYRYHSWGDDVDNQDFWTDGIADIVRVPNIILNSWQSQLVENRTLRNFGMQFYDATVKADGFVPSTFQPMPFGWYPVPGKPSEILQRVDIPDLSESLDEMEYIQTFTEKATGATPGQQGVAPPSGTPLGTTQLVEAEAKSRTKGISKFYTETWEQRAYTFLKLIEAAPEKIDACKICKKGKNSDTIYPREISPKDWMTKLGYKVKVWSQDEKNSNDTRQLTKLQALKVAMPDNPKVDEIYKRKLSEYADVTPDELNEIMDYETKKIQAPMPGMPGQMQNGANPGIMPQQQQPQLPQPNQMPQLTA